MLHLVLDHFLHREEGNSGKLKNKNYHKVWLLVLRLSAIKTFSRNGIYSGILIFCASTEVNIGLKIGQFENLRVKSQCSTEERGTTFAGYRSGIRFKKSRVPEIRSKWILTKTKIACIALSLTETVYWVRTTALMRRFLTKPRIKEIMQTDNVSFLPNKGLI